MEKNNENLYVTYQLFFNKFLEECGYDFEILNSNDDSLDYMLLLTDFDKLPLEQTLKVLLSLNVQNKELIVFSVIKPTIKNYFRKINDLNMRIPYGKLYFAKSRILYYLKVKLPNNLDEFSLESFEEYVMEIKYAFLSINKKAWELK